MLRLVRLLVVIGLVAFAAAWAGSPLLAARALGQAAERRDARALERLVDFPALRQSVKAELRERRLAGLAARRDPLSRAGAWAGGALIGGAVEAAVTPRGLTALLLLGGAGRPDGAAAEGKAAEPGPALAYRGPNTFAVGIGRRTAKERPPVTLLLKRRGLFVWKLEAVELADPPARARGA